MSQAQQIYILYFDFQTIVIKQKYQTEKLEDNKLVFTFKKHRSMNLKPHIWMVYKSMARENETNMYQLSVTEEDSWWDRKVSVPIIMDLYFKCNII